MVPSNGKFVKVHRVLRYFDSANLTLKLLSYLGTKEEDWFNFVVENEFYI